jgi:lipopolysaccharide transport system ATP-binding protein
MSSNNVLLRVDNLHKRFAHFENPSDRMLRRFKSAEPKSESHVLSNINFTLKQGEVIGIVGGNGAGKTTLLRVLSGILPPSDGSVETNGRVCPILDLGFGLVDDISGIENIFFIGSLRGFTKKDIQQRLEQITNFADLGAAIEDPIKHYSTGMKMRLAYAVSTHLDPDILIIDEALAVGDEGFQHKCFEHLRSLAKRGVGIVLVSHSSQTIQEFCDRALLLDQGECILSGNPAKVIEAYHHLLFATPEHRTSTRQAILEQRASATDPNLNTEETTLLDPTLSADSKVYAEQGASISNVSLMSGTEEVNLLHSRQTYTYQFDVKFDRNLDQVRFGMLIKSITGFELGGSETSHLRKNVRAGDNMRIQFRLQCNLNPGNYFLNAGVLALQDGEETFVARVIDAIQFKVLPNEFHQTGQVDFNIHADIQVR